MRRYTGCHKYVPYGLGLLLNALQMGLVFETFLINFVDLFGAGWSGGEPSVFGDDL